MITKDVDLDLLERISEDGIADGGIMARCPHCNQRILACLLCDLMTGNENSKDTIKNFRRHIKTHYNKRAHSSISAASLVDDSQSSSGNCRNETFGDCNLEPIAAVDVEDLQAAAVDVEDDDMHAGGSTTNKMSVDDEEDNQNPMKEWRLDNFKESIGDIHAARYFFDNHRASCGGIRGMVYRCINRTDWSVLADWETTLLYFDLLSLTFDMPDPSREKQMRLIKMIFESHQRRLRHGEVVLTFPVSLKHLDRQVLRNQFALSNQLPIEQIKAVDDHHAFVSIGDTIDMMMAHGELPLGWLQDDKGNRSSDGVNGYPAASDLLHYTRQKIREQGLDPNNVAIGWVSPWSDGFVTSWVKMAKKGSWMFTVSICMPPSSKLFRLYTHVVALGPSSVDNHDDLIVHALTEINALCTVKKRYCGVRKRWIQTAFGMLVYAADRPERHCITYTLDGGNYGKRFGYTAYINKCHLPSCQVCFKSRIMRLSLNTEDAYTTAGHSCELCCDWNYDIPHSKGWQRSSSLQKIFPKGDAWRKYPKSSSGSVQVPLSRALPEESHIRPMRLTFQFLIDGVSVAFHNLTTGAWHSYHKDMYLQTYGVNGAILKMCDQASAKAKEELAAIDNEAERGERLKAMLSTDELLRLGAIPKIWSLGLKMRLDIDHFIEIPMHHLFTGKYASV